MGAIKASGTAVVVGVGAERGLGAALRRRFPAEGYHVLVAGRTPEKITQVAKTICATGGSAEAITVDTTREDDVIRLFDGAMSPHNGRAAADVVNNESSEIIRMLNSAFDAFTDVRTDYYPAELRPEIDRINELVYSTVNNGVYRGGFATTQLYFVEKAASVVCSLHRRIKAVSPTRFAATT